MAKASKKPKAKTSAKPIKQALTKSGLVQQLSASSGVDAKSVKAVLAALESTMAGSISRKGFGTFTLAGLIKVTTQAIPAKPKRQGKDPFTGEMRWFAAKPATIRVRARALKKLKDAALA